MVPKKIRLQIFYIATPLTYLRVIEYIEFTVTYLRTHLQTNA